MDAQKTIYNAYLYKSPGFRKLIRYKAHHWGVETLSVIMNTQRKLIEQSKLAKEKTKEKKDQVIEKALE
jgi:hypothetical protein